MQSKSATHSHIVHFTIQMEKQFTMPIKIIWIDNGVELLIHDYFSSKGIIHQTTCIETLQQNGIVERKHQHVLNVSRALHFQSNQPLTC